MNPHRLVKVSKYLSKHLRHQPERLGLKLAAGGWVNIEELLAACQQHQFPLTRGELEEVVIKNDKQRFSFDETKTRIRANQGHTIEVDLQLKPRIPPDILYHGTGEGTVEAILEYGLLKMFRHHVHLSTDIATAKAVGMRKGRPVIFQVNAAEMSQEGFTFYCSDNGVWLVEQVPAKYLTRLNLD
ncbi:MAG: RNA 2'-phosphotransferase [Lyngbya sp.]|nr:RNA 2'-phosphotransferase [Lyngbya sp.]